MDAVRITEFHGFFRRPVEFKIFPGDRLTKIPITKSKNYSFLYLLWLKYSPKVWKDYKRHQSHMRFLDKQAFPKNVNIRKTFGNFDYIEAEKSRVIKLPPIEFNNFYPRQRSRSERHQSLHQVILSAIEEVKAKSKVRE